MISLQINILFVIVVVVVWHVPFNEVLNFYFISKRSQIPNMSHHFRIEYLLMKINEDIFN